MTNSSERAQYLSSYEWTKDRDEFGGYSGLAISPDGKSFTILSDRAHIIEGSILRHEGRILGVRSQRLEQLDFPDALFDEPPTRDTEGLALDSEGQLYVSLESENRIIKRSRDGNWSILPDAPQMQVLPLNRGLEAVAVTEDGFVFTIPETSSSLKSPFPVLRHCPTKGWDAPYTIPRMPGLVPVGADFDSLGRFYVLERGFSGFGFFSQVRRFDLGSEPVLSGEVLLRTRPRRHDNLEGLGVWTAPDGTLRLTMISDDNFNRFQKTEIVEYALRN